MKLYGKILKKSNIALIGLMGSGKSIIGKKLAKKLDFNYIDTDSTIQKETGFSIIEIFEKYGEKHFRKIEEKIVIKSLNFNKSVISLGGGSILSKKIQKLLVNKSFTIYLDVEIEILHKRLEHSKKRPLLFNANIKDKLSQLYKIRHKYYKKADLSIKNNSSQPNEIVKKIISYLKKINE